MFDIPLETANAIYGAANVTLVVGAILVATGTIAAILAGGVRDRFADERVSQNEADTARATAAAAKAGERSALLEAEAEKARLETERLKQQLAWRRLAEQQFPIIAREIGGSNLELSLVVIANDPESKLFASDIRRALVMAGIKVSRSDAIIAGDIVVGIHIYGPKVSALKIRNAFANAGLDTQIHEQEGKLQIVVGSKPPPE